MIRAGVLSDTHLMQPDDRFRDQVKACFHDCDVIIHAGDITDLAILEVFGDKKLYAVHGNMCDNATRTRYPEHLLFALSGFQIGLAHGARLGLDIEDAIWNLFPEADCLIYGHTHKPACHSRGKVLFLNPGSFRATSRYGAPGTYAILEAGDQLRARLYDIPPVP
jgi:putative phosphoesterase